MSTHFDLAPELLYVNHAGVSPWPRRTVEAVQRFAAENGTRGAADYPRWLKVEARLRESLAQLLGAGSHTDLALVKSTSEGLSIVAYGLDWQPGDNVVGIAQEFPSNRILWQSLTDQGVDYRPLDLYASMAPEADLEALCDARTRLIAVSSVQFARGLRLDLERLADFCRVRGILLGVDAIQSLGALPFDLTRVPVDFLAADGHKWMLGPEGLAVLYVSPALRPRLRLHEYGWHMMAQAGDYESSAWSPAADATRFECGSPNMLGIVGLEASLSLLLEIGMASVQAAIADRVEHLIDLVDQQGFQLLSPREPERRAGILTFRVPGVDSAALYRSLMTRGVICAQRGGGVRFSPHFYTPEETLDRAVALAAELAAGLPTG